MIVVVAPVVEEFFKTIIVKAASCERSLAPRLVALSALSFGMVELFVHSVFLGGYVLSITFIMHVVFSLPAGYAYAKSKKLYPLGLMVSIILHALWNLMVITLF